MTESELLAWRQILTLSLLSELTVRNTVLAETLRSHISGKTGVTVQDGIQETLSLLDRIAERNRAQFRGELEAQMLADEMQEAVERLKVLARNLAASLGT